MDTRRLLIAAALSLVVMLAWGYLFPPAEAPERPPVELTAETIPSQAPEPQPPEPREEAVTAEPGAAVAIEPEESTAPSQTEPIAATREERLVIEGADFRAELTNRGGQLVSYQLLEHENADGGPVDLVRARAESPYPFGLADARGASLPLNEALFETERSVSQLGEQVITFRFRGLQGEAEKRFLFRSDGMIDFAVTYGGETGWGVVMGPGIRNPSQAEAENRFARRSAAFRNAEGVEKIDPARAKEATILPAAGVSWAGLQDTYFLTALVPGRGAEEVLILPAVASLATDGQPAIFRVFRSADELSETEADLGRELFVHLQPAAGSLEAVAYLGPKQYDRLKSLPYGLEEAADFGFFSVLSLPLLKGLQWIYENVVANYGWAIILMTILIRIVLFPLTHKSTVSMQKMQEVNPKVQAIRQKYKGKLKDKQGRPNAEMQRKMNEETMALYKTEGVNPAGGCLPMVLQIPVLFAFYSLLSAAIEIRHAPWILWIHDLSAKDPLYVLPIVMGATQFLQQRMTPASGDPMQRRMMSMMPIFFTVLFLGFPSGLVLYWLTNNVLGIAQQVFYKRLKESKAAAAESAASATGESKKKKGSNK